MFEYSFVSFAIGASFFASFFAIKIIVPVAFKVGLVDTPDKRKQHIGEVPLIGGIAIFIGMLTSTSLIYSVDASLDLYIISSAFIVFIGVLDDYKGLSVRLRLVAQVLASSIMVYGAKVYIVDFGNILSLGNIQLYWLGYPFTIVAAIAAMNAFNMSDGIDGLVGVLSLSALGAISFLLLSGNNNLFLLPLLLGFSTVPYLFFNLGIAGGKAKKIFMGDAGSMFVGMSVAWLLVAGSQGDSPAFRPVVALWIIAIPLMDMISLTVRRARSGKSPFTAGRDHLHHLFMDAGLCQKKTLITIASLAILTMGAGLVMEILKVSESIMFFSFILMLVAYFRLTGILRRFGRP